MEIELADVAYDASVWDVKRTFGAILHGEDFHSIDPKTPRAVNFRVILNPGAGGVQNNGSGSLILPSRRIGDRLLRRVYEEGKPIIINGRKMRLFRGKKAPGRGLRETLEKTPYLEPDEEEKHEDKLRRLDIGLHVDKVQFGVFYRRPEDPMTAPRIFSNEYEISHRNKGAGLLWFEYDHKLIRIQLGDRMTEEIGSNVAIHFSNIRKVAIGMDFGNPFVCFDLLTPPMFERERFNRTLTGNDWNDHRKFRQRLDSLTPAHAVVAPYAHHMRVIMHTEADIRKFRELCEVAEVQRPIWANVEAFSRGFFSPKQLHKFHCWLRQFDWRVAFQIEALLRGGFLNTEDILGSLRPYLEKLYKDMGRRAATVLRNFCEALRTRSPKDSVMDCFQRAMPEGGKRNNKARKLAMMNLDEVEEEAARDRDMGKFECHHVTFTPTRVILEGPYVGVSNRVIRQFVGFEDHFIRVDFRDEDRLQYRWAREVDGTTLLTERVGGVLKNGFDLGGRHYEFLAYSSSALREHAVWFMNPFEHPTQGYMTAQRIRDSLGDFSNVIRYPSKYAARLAQAFTATDPSVSITRDQWEEMNDLGEEPYLFTDGVGTISQELGDMIWEALCTAKESLRRVQITPDAYQIRFLGYKGVVVVDRRLQGIKMRLRPSMNKFEALDKDVAPIEIARWFDRPGTTYLNKALIMILEDRGVDQKVFLKLQELAAAKITTASDSVEETVTLLKAHNLGQSFSLPYILQGLRAVGLGMRPEAAPAGNLNGTFLQSLVIFAQHHVLRDIKHGARIPIPDSYLLVGVADEGPAYVQEGVENVFTLKEGQIYVCIQNEDDEKPTYLKGTVSISRSPVVHPGDVQRVWAIGEPPAGQECFFRGLKNVVVLPSVGKRSLASMLGGGDLDGDLYSVIKYDPLLPTEHKDPADYTGVGTRSLPDGRESTVDDICDFIVEYINSDLLGLLSDRHLIIADQSKDGTSDPACIELARLCSQAVDYPKNGVPVDIFDSPRLLIREKPDWKKAEDSDPRDTDYYFSSRALGELFRSIDLNNLKLPTTPAPIPDGGVVLPPQREQPLSDVISLALRPFVEGQLHYFYNADRNVAEMKALFLKYEQELRYICVTHALSDAPDIRLREEEVVVGTILAVCSQQRWRKDRMHRMRLHSSELVRDVKRRLYQPADVLNPEQGELLYGLSQAWLAWDFGMRNRTVFGARSFSLVALGVVLDTLTKLGSLVV
ncbi:RdRP-domain-containing protein [Pilatotrama ljubarskyi]|nr:RdRP-domain-containing protein [Pilatotrama ljubarskyi]